MRAGADTTIGEIRKLMDVESMQAGGEARYLVGYLAIFAIVFKVHHSADLACFCGTVAGFSIRSYDAMRPDGNGGGFRRETLQGGHRASDARGSDCSVTNSRGH